MFTGIHPRIRTPIHASSPLPSPLTMSVSHWFLLVLFSMLWGSATFFNKIAVRDIEPFTVVFLRVLLAAILIHGLIRVSGLPLRVNRRDWGPYVVMGLLNIAVPFSLIAWGVIGIESGLAGVLLATTPIFTALVAHIFPTNEHLSTVKVAGIGFAMAGVLMIVGWQPLSITHGSGISKLAILGAALSYGISGVYGLSLRDRPPLTVVWGQLWSSTVILAPLVIIFDQPWQAMPWSRDATMAIGALAVLGTVIRYLVFYRLLAAVGAINTSLVGFLIPVSSLLLGIVFLGERPHGAHLVGIALLAIGLAVIDGRLLRSRAKPEVVGLRLAGRRPSTAQWVNLAGQSPGRPALEHTIATRSALLAHARRGNMRGRM